MDENKKIFLAAFGQDCFFDAAKKIIRLILAINKRFEKVSYSISNDPVYIVFRPSCILPSYTDYGETIEKDGKKEFVWTSFDKYKSAVKESAKASNSAFKQVCKEIRLFPWESENITGFIFGNSVEEFIKKVYEAAAEK